MQNACVLNQEILINPELYHPCCLQRIMWPWSQIKYTLARKMNISHYLNEGIDILTRLCRMYFPIHIHWTSPFPILG